MPRSIPRRAWTWRASSASSSPPRCRTSRPGSRSRSTACSRARWRSRARPASPRPSPRASPAWRACAPNPRDSTNDAGRAGRPDLRFSLNRGDGPIRRPGRADLPRLRTGRRAPARRQAGHGPLRPRHEPRHRALHAQARQPVRELDPHRQRRDHLRARRRGGDELRVPARERQARSLLLLAAAAGGALARAVQARAGRGRMPRCPAADRRAGPDRALRAALRGCAPGRRKGRQRERDGRIPALERRLARLSRRRMRAARRRRGDQGVRRRPHPPKGARPQMTSLHRLCVAPMMDWTDRHCRYFLRQVSSTAFLYTEMITTGALLHGDVERHLAFSPEEHPVGVQLGGSEPDDLARCAKLAEDYGYDEVNLNIGCPSERVQRGAFGACLMAEPELVADCVRAIREKVKVPVTVKHRLGLDRNDSYDFVLKFVDRVSKAGCNTFVVHALNAILKGLSPKENREIPPLRYEAVYRLKQDFPALEIVLNGGLKSIEPDPRVDGIMLGRAAYHDSWVLADPGN